MPCEECTNEKRIEALEKDSERNQITHREYFGMFEALKINSARTDEKTVRILESMAELKSELKGSMAELKGQVAELAAKPGRRWESVVLAIIGGITGIAVGYFFK